MDILSNPRAIGLAMLRSCQHSETYGSGVTENVYGEQLQETLLYPILLIMHDLYLHFSILIW